MSAMGNAPIGVLPAIGVELVQRGNRQTAVAVCIERLDWP